MKTEHDPPGPEQNRPINQLSPLISAPSCVNKAEGVEAITC